MKKCISMALALTLTLALSVPVLAADLSAYNGSQDVTATYVAGSSGSTTVGTTYRVDLSWNVGALTYTGASGSDVTYTWDVNDLQYTSSTSGGAAGGWTKNEADVTITVTNYSNADVTATAGYADVEGDDVTTNATWDNDGKVTCTSAAAGLSGYSGQGKETTGTITGKITASGSIAASTKVGAISITLA